MADIQFLEQVMKSIYGGGGEKVDTSKLRYVLYARKSTDDPKRQTRSIPDQIYDCKKMADDKGYKIIKIIKESKSAKQSGERPEFLQMIEDIKKNKYDGVISWHPDRLSRNMSESGMIIDLIDKGTIKDLQFQSFTFENTAAGKMLLGISFVLSKHYSDHLSDNVLRGNRRHTTEGFFIGKLKHGYYIDEQQNLRPDDRQEPDNFALIKRAWEMRLQKITYDEIAKFLNESGYQRASGIGGLKHKAYKMDKKVLSIMFQDSVYAGVLTYGKEVSNLVELAGFEPMITPDEFFTINPTGKFAKLKERIRGINQGAVKADLFRGNVFCAECGKPMASSLPSKMLKGGKTHYYFYVCINPECKYQNKNARAKVILDFVIDFLENNKEITGELYKMYKDGAVEQQKENYKQLDSQRRSLRQKRTSTEEKLRNTKNLLLDTGIDPQTKHSFNNDIPKLESEIKEIEQKIANVDKAIEINEQTIYEYEKFIELCEKLPQIFRKQPDMAWRDFIIRKIFSNFYISFEDGTGIKAKIVKYELIEPFKSMLKNAKVSNGRIC